MATNCSFSLQFTQLQTEDNDFWGFAADQTFSHSDAVSVLLQALTDAAVFAVTSTQVGVACRAGPSKIICEV